MVGEAIEERAGEALGAEHLGPFVERQIGGDQGRSAPLLALAEHLELRKPVFDSGTKPRRRRRSEACRWREFVLEPQQLLVIAWPR